MRHLTLDAPRNSSPRTGLSRRSFLAGFFAATVAAGGTAWTSPAAAAEWKGYTEALLASGKYEHVAVFRGNGDEIARTEGFEVAGAEAVTHLERLQQGAAAVQRARFVLGGESWSFRRAVGGRLAVAKRDGRYAVVIVGEVDGGWVITVAVSKQFESEKVYKVAEACFDEQIPAATEEEK